MDYTMKLTSNERRVLRELAKPVGTRNYAICHGHTIHALERKGLFEINPNGEPGGLVTTAGRTELSAPIPNIFDDLFDQNKKQSSMSVKTARKQSISSSTKAKKQAAALARLQTVSEIEIEMHPLMDDEQRRLCKMLRKASLRDQVPFTLLAFAKIALRATGNDYAAWTDAGGATAAEYDLRHQRAAVLYVYEAIKAGPPIIAETAAKRGTLKDLELLVFHD